MIGENILHYEILEKLGEGGMGVVYKARDTRLERTVALKFLSAHFSGNADEERERFKTEAKAAAALNHPNIATIYAIEETDDKIFIVMEYVQGEELKAKIERGPLNLSEVGHISRQIARGLKVAHEQGVIHRDIKSSNIMITDQDEVKIMDFGLAKIAGGTQVTKTSTSLGTPSYMSPEQARGEKLDHRTDVWSLGVVMYEIACGHLPFEGDYEMAVAYSIINEEPKPPREWRSEIPQQFESVVMRAMAKNREERYQSSGELEADLEGPQVRETNAQPLSEAHSAATLSARTRFAMAAALAILLAATLYSFFKPRATTPPSFPSIAVLPFQFEGDENSRWLSSAITELVSSNLAQRSDLRVLDVQRRAGIMQSLGVGMTNLTQEQAFAIARKSKVDKYVTGTLRKTASNILVQSKLFEGTDGTLSVDLTPIQKEASNIFVAASDLTTQIANQLAIGKQDGDVPLKPATPSLDAFRYFIEGRDAAFDKRHHESIERLTKAVTHDSTFIRAYYFLAWQYANIGDDSAAKKVLTKIKPHISELSKEERLQYLSQLAQYEDRWRDYAAHHEELLRLKPDDALYNFRYGFAQYFKFRLLQAGIEAMERSIELDSTYGWGYNTLALAYIGIGDKQKALTAVDKYIALNPGNVNPIDTKAEIQLYIGQYDAAIVNCNRILDMQPDFLSALSILARAYTAQANYTRALRTIGEYMQMANSLRYMSLGQTEKAHVHLLRGELSEALETVDQAVAMDSTNVLAHWTRGRILAKLGKKQALAHELTALDRALHGWGALDGKWFSYHLSGEMALLDGAFQDAIDYFTRAVKIGALDRSFYLVALANAYKKSGELDQALQQYNAALAFNPNNGWAAFGLASSHKELGNSAQATRAFQRVLEIWSNADAGTREVDIARTELRSYSKKGGD